MKQNKKKNFIQLMFVILICLFICSCSREEPGPKNVVYNGTIYTIDDEAMTISDGKNTYRYEGNGTSSSYSYRIFYPNGATYYWTWSGNIGHGGWSDDYDESLYVDGRTLMNVLETELPEESEPKNILMIIFLIGVGVLNVAAPQTSWYLSDGWRYKNAEPSDTALELTRVGGIVAIIIAVFLILA